MLGPRPATMVKRDHGDQEFHEDALLGLSVIPPLTEKVPKGQGGIEFEVDGRKFTIFLDECSLILFESKVRHRVSRVLACFVSSDFEE